MTAATDPIAAVPQKLPLERLIEIGRVLALTLATVLAAWCGFQAARWGGLMAIRFSEANAARVESVRSTNEANEYFLVDLNVFQGWLGAFAQNNTALADFYESNFRPPLRSAFDAWRALDPQNNPDAPRNPFTPELYVNPFNAESDAHLERAQGKFADALAANQISDQYVLNTVLLASTLFLAAIADRFKALRPRAALTLVADVLLLGVLITALAYPIH